MERHSITVVLHFLTDYESCDVPNPVSVLRQLTEKPILMHASKHVKTFGDAF